MTLYVALAGLIIIVAVLLIVRRKTDKAISLHGPKPGSLEIPKPTIHETVTKTVTKTVSKHSYKISPEVIQLIKSGNDAEAAQKISESMGLEADNAQVIVEQVRSALK